MSLTIHSVSLEAPALLTFEIRNSRPIELGDLATSLNAFRDTYSRFIEAEGTAIDGEDIQLFVREIRSGSIIVELFALASMAPTLIEHATAVTTTVTRFAKSIRDAIEFFRGTKAEPPPTLTAKDAHDLGRVLGPAINDTGGGINIIASEGSNVQVRIELTSDQAAGVKLRSANWAALRDAPKNDFIEGALFYWFQARGDSQSKTGDRGIIESISQRPIKVSFASEEIKRAMLEEALFRKAYVVDVKIQTVAGRPQLYTITNVTDSFDRDEEA